MANNIRSLSADELLSTTIAIPRKWSTKVEKKRCPKAAETLAALTWEWRYKANNTVSLFENERFVYEVDLDRLKTAADLANMLDHLSGKALMIDSARLGGFVRLLSERNLLGNQ